MNNGQFVGIVAKHSQQFSLTARKHLRANKHMHDLTDKQISVLTDDHVRAILNGFVNFLAAEQCGMDYAMNTSDFRRVEGGQ